MAFDPNSKVIAIDTETTGLNAWQSDMPFCFGLCDLDGETWSCQWHVDPYTRQVMPDSDTYRFLRDILGRKNTVKVFHNAPFDWKMIQFMDIPINGRIEDTLFMSRIYNNVAESNALKPLAWELCGIGIEDVDVLHERTIAARKYAKAMGWTTHESPYADYWMPKQVWPDDNSCEEYCRTDVQRTMALWYVFNHLFEKDTEGLYRKTYERELDLFKIVMQIETRGVHIDRERVIKEREISIIKREESYNEMVKIVGHHFSPNSPKQLGEIIYGRLGLKCTDWSAGGDPSTRLVTLRKYANVPFIDHLLTHRSAHKSIGTFFDNYLEVMCPDEISPGHWCMHPNINQCLTRTHRFSMHNPNLQQVANANTSTLGGRMVMARAPFGPRPGYLWFSADYAQQELRIFTDLADIKLLKEVIQEGKDPNTENANFAWGGRGNEAAVYAAKLALNFKDPDPDKPGVREIWNEFGWDPDRQRLLGGLDSREADRIARIWLDRFDWKIVQAEKSLGKANTRSRCKIVIFDIMYGGGAESLVKLLFCTSEEAKAFMNVMHKRYPEIRRYTQKLMREIKENGFVTNPYGRRLKTETGREYTSVNYMIQSSAADMMKEAIRSCNATINKYRLDAHVVLTVHDELLFEIKNEHTHLWFIKKLKEDMERCPQFGLPIVTEFNACPKQWDGKFAVNFDMDPNTLVSDYIATKIGTGTN